MTIDILSDAQKEASNALNAVALNIAAGGTKMKAQIQHAEMLSGIAKALLSVAKNDDEEKLGELSLELTKRDKHIAVSSNLFCIALNICSKRKSSTKPKFSTTLQRTSEAKT